MVDLCIRRVVIQVDEIHHEMGKKIDPPTRKATAAAAIINPYAGNYKENLEPLIVVAVVVADTPRPLARVSA